MEGDYVVLASGSSYNTSGSGTISYAITKNSTVLTDTLTQAGGTSGRYVFCSHTITTLSVGDTVKLQAMPSDGGTSTIRPGARITLIRIG